MPPADKKNYMHEMSSLDFDRGLTIPKLFVQKAREYGPKRVAMREKEHGIWRPITWREYHDRVKAITLGLALRDEIPERSARYGWAVVPMDEALAEAAVDLGSRPYYVGRTPSRLYTHFLQSFATNLGATVHVRVVRGEDRHHMVEAAVKALGLALRQALAEGDQVFSTKGSVKLERLS